MHKFALLLFALLLLSYSRADSHKDREDVNPILFNTADRIHAIATGSISERGHALHPESGPWCQSPVNFKYRTIDGTCNHPTNLGSSFKTFDRLLPPAYDDGTNSPRQRGKDGRPLPGARTVRLRLHPPVDAFARFTIALMNWGQWTDHDISATAEIGRGVSCCGPNGEHLTNSTDPNCFPIEVPPNDPSFPGECLQFTRSLAAVDSNGIQLKPRKQIAIVTSFIDCSQIYGSTLEAHAQVRVPKSFLLRTKNRHFLPESPTAGCRKREGTDDYCFLSGDVRVNQNPFIAALHTLWLREHNRIARRLKKLRPHSSNEEIFQLTRKIIIAKNQIITYNAFLPHILGRDAKRWKLVSNKGRSFYNPDLDPSILMEFASAAFRFGHSTIPSYVPSRNSFQLLRDNFNRPALVLDDFDGLLTGMAGLSNVRRTNMQTSDRNIVEDVSKFLFFNKATGQGLDLPTLNIHRAREHGVQPYVQWRSFCGLRPLAGFNDTEALGPFANELRKVYRSVDDIDLFTGMLHEPADTGLVGPTIRCIIRMQFFRLKYGDRFFFNNDEPSSGFTDEQLNSLLKVTLSKVICQNTNIKSIPRDVFRFKSTKNPLVDCRIQKKEDLDLSVFA